MKSRRFSLAILSFCAIFTLASCSKSNDFIETTKEIVQQGNWTVDYYYSGQDLTSQYHDYQFKFNINGTVAASSHGNQFTGNWNITHDHANREVLNFQLATSEPHINTLSASWTINASTTDRVDMTADATNFRIRRN